MIAQSAGNTAGIRRRTRAPSAAADYPSSKAGTPAATALAAYCGRKPSTAGLKAAARGLGWCPFGKWYRCGYASGGPGLPVRPFGNSERVEVDGRLPVVWGAFNSARAGILQRKAASTVTTAAIGRAPDVGSFARDR